MPDVRRHSAPVQISVSDYDGEPIVAAAARMTGSITDHLIQNREWQREAWDFYHAMGEFWYGVTWLANACSRIRLVAAKKQAGGDEPERIDPDKATGSDEKAVAAVERLSGGVGGRSMLLESLAVQLSVPGEGYVVGEEVTDDASGSIIAEDWTVKSTDEIRRRMSSDKQSRRRSKFSRIDPLGERLPSPYEIQVEENRWRSLSPESTVCRVWWPDKQFSWRACSAALPALPILRELDLINRRIISELVSRIAMNGILVIPSESTFVVRPEFKDAVDPFIAEIIDTASKAIKTPGSAAAAVPMPLRVPAALIDKIQHIKFSDPLDPKIFEARDRALKRLAATLNVPQEVVLGIADVNHWTAWQIDETAVKIHIAPLVEIMCHSLTISYYRPALIAAGVPESEIQDYVVWYDASELTTKPDLSEAANKAHGAVVISDAAYRREAGFSEDDAPSKDEMKTQLLVALALQGNAQAFKELTGVDITSPTPGYDETGRPLAPVPTPGSAQPNNQEKGPPPTGPNPPANGRVPAPVGR